MPTVTAAGSALTDALALTLGDALTLALRLGVPLHTHTPLAGAPQKTKQHSAGQDDGETLGVTLVVAERCAQTHVKGATGAHTYVPAQPEDDADNDGDTGLFVVDSVTEGLAVHDGDGIGDGCDERDVDGDDVAVSDGVCGSDGDGDAVADADCDGDAVCDGDALGDAVCDGDALGDAEADGELEPSAWQQTGCEIKADASAERDEGSGKGAGGKA